MNGAFTYGGDGDVCVGAIAERVSHGIRHTEQGDGGGGRKNPDRCPSMSQNLQEQSEYSLTGAKGWCEINYIRIINVPVLWTFLTGSDVTELLSAVRSTAGGSEGLSWGPEGDRSLGSRSKFVLNFLCVMSLSKYSAYRQCSGHNWNHCSIFILLCRLILNAYC